MMYAFPLVLLPVKRVCDQLITTTLSRLSYTLCNSDSVVFLSGCTKHMEPFKLSLEDFAPLSVPACRKCIRDLSFKINV